MSACFSGTGQIVFQHAQFAAFNISSCQSAATSKIIMWLWVTNCVRNCSIN